ncbi:hypothetical protein HYT56_01030 [Candidatus Woesearchaeota archaeon]|nr:hypothetical protein [Candidatus Woesearchaeota archaeon]
MNEPITSMDQLKDENIGRLVEIGDTPRGVYVGLREGRLPTIVYRNEKRVIIEQTFYILREARKGRKEITGASTFQEIDPESPAHSAYSVLLEKAYE